VESTGRESTSWQTLQWRSVEAGFWSASALVFELSELSDYSS